MTTRRRDRGSGPVPPYGTAIREAVARGDTDELRSLVQVVRESLHELARLDAVALGAAGAGGDLNRLRMLEEAVERLEEAVRHLEA